MSYRRKYRPKNQSYSEDVTLIERQYKQNDFDETIEIEPIKTVVMARETGVSRQDVYQSRVAGFNAELSLEINKVEYHGEKELIFNGEHYKVIKQYPLGNDVELTCEKIIYEKN